MADFQWVGGYTDHKGFLSGYSNDWNGTGKEVWTSVWNGITNEVGDRSFGPYYWGFVQNWFERTPSQGQNGETLYTYSPATRLPHGGDRVIFGARTLTADGSFEINRRLGASIACLFGGVSGNDGRWIGGAGSTLTGDIEVEVTPYYGTNSGSALFLPFRKLRYGEVGFGEYWGNWDTSGGANSAPIWGQNLLRGVIGFNSSQIREDGASAANFALTGDRSDGSYLVETENYIDPLDLRFVSFDHKSTEAKVYLRQASNSVAGAASVARMVSSYFMETTAITNPTDGNPKPLWSRMGFTGNVSELNLVGKVHAVEQDNGYFRSIRYKSVGLSADNVYIRENLIGAYIDESSTINISVVCRPKYSRTPINIHCGAPYLSTWHNTDQTYSYPGYEVQDETNKPLGLTYNIGNRYGGEGSYGCTFGRWDCSPLGFTSTNRFGEPTPKVHINHLQSDAFYAYGGTIKVSPDQFTGRPVFRDGFLKNDTILDLRKEDDDNYRLAIIGGTSSDEGLRIDSLNARIYLPRGTKFKIKSKGDPEGLT
jgi:hypothetical protein